MSSGPEALRILHIIVHLSAGGAELMMKRLIEALTEDGRIEQRVISLRGLGTVGPMLQASGIEVEALNVNTPWALPSAMARLVRRIRAWQPDVVQTWMYHADLMGGLAARLAGVRRIVWNVRIAEISPGFGVSRVTGWIMRACAVLSRNVPDRIVYVARSAVVSHEGAGYDPSKSVYIPNGYALAETDESVDLRHSLGLAPETRLIASAGRYNRQKNHIGFVRSAAMVADGFSDVQFVLFGQGVTADNAELQAAIAATGRADRFHCVGEVERLPRFLREADLFCLHSLSEGFPNVVAEAMAAGTPCVVTRVGDAAELVEDTGWTVDPADDAKLTDALMLALSLDAGALADYGMRARDRIAKNFSMPKIADMYSQLYRELADRGSSGPETD